MNFLYAGESYSTSPFIVSIDLGPQNSYFIIIIIIKRYQPTPQTDDPCTHIHKHLYTVHGKQSDVGETKRGGLKAVLSHDSLIIQYV